ncbi:MAG TPA: nucleoside 2-deoxyribosyltransferase [Drouetiella sp.]
MTTTEKTNTAASKIVGKRTRLAKKPFTVYLAGDLWTHKDLIGNALLGDFIKKVSKGRYECVLPQDLEEPINRSVDIRNYDLKHVMTCDMAIFNFDGANLDAGTVVEFIYAKMLDIPCVILRTDFRAAGEGGEDQDPWNLMATRWPRTQVLKLHGMAEYQGCKTPGDVAKTIRTWYRKMAVQIIEQLDNARAEKPLLQNPAQIKAIYDWALRCPGAGYDTLFGDNEVHGLLAAKTAKGLTV